MTLLTFIFDDIHTSLAFSIFEFPKLPWLKIEVARKSQIMDMKNGAKLLRNFTNYTFSTVWELQEMSSKDLSKHFLSEEFNFTLISYV